MGGQASTCAGRRYSRGRGDHRRHRHRQVVAPQIGVRRLDLDRRGVWLAGPAAEGIPVGEGYLKETTHVENSKESRR